MLLALCFLIYIFLQFFFLNSIFFFFIFLSNFFILLFMLSYSRLEAWQVAKISRELHTPTDGAMIHYYTFCNGHRL